MGITWGWKLMSWESRRDANECSATPADMGQNCVGLLRVM